MAENLKQKTTRGLVWSGIERLSGQIVSFILALILARLVTPADYGILAIVMVFIAVSGLMVDAGFANALIRKVDCSDEDRSTVLYFNISASIVMYIILWFSAPLLSNIYDNNDLTNLIRCASTVVIINSLSIVQQAILTSRIDFKIQTLISLVSSISSGVTGIILAYIGYGVWALVAQSVLMSLVRTIMLWTTVRWKPLFVFSKESFKDLFGYSYKLMLSNLIVNGGKQVIQLILGKFYGVADLGYYNYAYKLGAFVPTNTSTAIQRVLFPAFSKIQDDDTKLAENFRKSLVFTMAFIVPIMFGLAALAKPIIKILLTEEWLPAIPLLQIVCVTMTVWSLLFFNMNIMWVKKRSDLSLKLEIISVSLRLLLVFVLFQTGILWVCIALCVADIINFLVYAFHVGKINPYGLLPQLKDLIPIFFAGTITAYIANLFVVNYVESPFLQIFITAVFTPIFYALIIFVTKGFLYNTVKVIIVGKLTRRSR